MYHVRLRKASLISQGFTVLTGRQRDLSRLNHIHAWAQLGRSHAVQPPRSLHMQPAPASELSPGRILLAEEASSACTYTRGGGGPVFRADSPPLPSWARQRPDHYLRVPGLVLDTHGCSLSPWPSPTFELNVMLKSLILDIVRQTLTTL